MSEEQKVTDEPSDDWDTAEMAFDKHIKGSQDYLIITHDGDSDRFQMDCQMRQDRLILSLAKASDNMDANSKANLLHYLVTQEEVRNIHARMLHESFMADQDAAAKEGMN